jgi:hypothetical protein
MLKFGLPVANLDPIPILDPCFQENPRLIMSRITMMTKSKWSVDLISLAVRVPGDVWSRCIRSITQRGQQVTDLLFHFL